MAPPKKMINKKIPPDNKREESLFKKLLPKKLSRESNKNNI